MHIKMKGRLDRHVAVPSRMEKTGDCPHFEGIRGTSRRDGIIELEKNGDRNREKGTTS